MITRKETDHRDSMKIRFGSLLPVVAAAILVAGTPIRDTGAQTAGPVQIREMLQQARVLYEELLPVVRRLGDETLTSRMEALRSQWVQANGHLQGNRLQNAYRLAQRNLEQLRQMAAGDGDAMSVEVTVSDVRVNTGPPSE